MVMDIDITAQIKLQEVERDHSFWFPFVDKSSRPDHLLRVREVKMEKGTEGRDTDSENYEGNGISS